VNVAFTAFVLIAFAVATARELATPGAVMPALTQALVDEAGRAVTLAFGLVGLMALFLGVMKVAEAAGLLALFARMLRRPLRRLFPEIPSGHPAMGAIVLNIAANTLGLGNAATPFGLKAMQRLNELNPHPGTATNAMVLFLVINTANVTLLPTSVIALRAAAGSADPAGIVASTLLTTLCSTLAGIALAGLGSRLWPLPSPSAEVPPVRPQLAGSECHETGADDADAGTGSSLPDWLAFAALLLAATLLVIFGRELGPWLIPAMLAGFVTLGALRRVSVYTVLVDGAREGFDVAIRILPYLVAILVAFGMLRASGAMDLLIAPVVELLKPFGVPGEALIMAVLRSLSGSGAYAYLAAVLKDPAIGPDSYTGYLVSTIQGSTETTFYVVAVYCGVAGIRRMRHALVVGLLADLVGLIAAVVVCRALYV
jgi:spore maturation protein SpmA